MTMSASISTPPFVRQTIRFFRAPKGLLLVILSGVLAIAFAKLQETTLLTNVVVAAVTAAGLDMSLTYLRRRKWIIPDGAVITGMIVAFVLRPQESWLIIVTVVTVAILSKHALRTHWSNVLNPAAFALVVAALVFNTGQSWWGALPDLGVPGALIMLAIGVFLADRINKLPMILAFFGAYFTLLTIASFSQATTVAETFRAPDLQAALFFAFFMLDDPPSSPVRHEDQVVFGIIVAAVAYFVLLQYGGDYFLAAGLLAGNVWESARRVVVASLRSRENVAARRTRLQAASVASSPLRTDGLRLVSGVAVTLVATALLAAAVTTSGGDAGITTAATSSPASPGQSAAQAPAPANAFPFLDTFSADLTGTYTQTSDGAASSLTVDATTTGDVALKLHIELATTRASGQTSSNVTANKVELMRTDSGAVVCDGTLSAFNQQGIRASCDGAGPYQGVRMTLQPTLNSDSPTTLSGTLDGTMQRLQ